VAALLTRLQDDMKQAMKSGDTLSRDTLRLVISDIKKREVDERRDLSPEEELAVLQKAVKSREDSVAQYAAAQRTDLVEREQAEIAVIRRYLPTQLSEADTAALVERTIATLGLTAKKDLGQVMKAVLATHKGQVDGKLVQKLASERLA
jgi:uncharacterized protein YqeY